MKKIFFLLILFFLNIEVNAKEIKLSKCIDGDTAKFLIDEDIVSVRFLAIDAPETNTNDGKESANYVCNILKNAKKIEIEYDDNSSLYDKYNRQLGWIFVDDKLLQELIVKNGYAEVKYLYGDYKYTYLLKKDIKENNYNALYIGLIIIGGVMIYVSRLFIKSQKNTRKSKH